MKPDYTDVFEEMISRQIDLFLHYVKEHGCEYEEKGCFRYHQGWTARFDP